MVDQKNTTKPYLSIFIWLANVMVEKVPSFPFLPIFSSSTSSWFQELLEVLGILEKPMPAFANKKSAQFDLTEEDSKPPAKKSRLDVEVKASIWEKIHSFLKKIFLFVIVSNS